MSSYVLISRVGWTPTASANAGGAEANALDGNNATRWATGAAIVPNTSFFKIDMGAAHDVGRVVMNSAAHAGDCPLSGIIAGSNDNATWTTIGTWDAGNISGGIVTASFLNANYRYIRMTATGLANGGSGNWWGIDELNFYTGPADVPPVASGGTVSYDGAYTVHTFTANGNLTVTSAGVAEVLIVGGGGGGGDGQDRTGGGGGAGGVIHVAKMPLDDGVLAIVIGAGGAGGVGGVSAATAGSNSTFNGSAAIGGGRGAGFTTGNATVGGSGGGGKHGTTGAAGTAGQGNAGGNNGFNSGSGSGVFTGNGGGGAGAVGVDGTNLVAGAGGDGVQYNMDGTLRYYGGGGGGSAGNYGGQTVQGGAGGQGGGGAGGTALGAIGNGTAGTANRGGGGGAGGFAGSSGGGGGSGIVIVRYLSPSVVDAIIPLGLGVSADMDVTDTLDASIGLGLGVSSTMSPQDTIDAAMSLGLGVSSTIALGSAPVTARPCSLLLEVFEPVSLEYDAPDDSVVAWSVSTDPAHPFPYLLAPRQYAEQEIDPVACTATIGQVEVGVVDVPMDLDDQDTGWMTARVHDLLGRRCRLTRYVDATIGWVLIADGPAGMPSMDGSYSAYRWTIRDTRETERKLKAFYDGGTSGVMPRGSIYGFGHYATPSASGVLLPSLLEDESPVWGEMRVEFVGGQWVGKVVFDAHYVGRHDPGVPTEEQMHIYNVSLQSIDQWAAIHRANGENPYDMSSGHGNQGLDAIIISNGITIDQFNQGAINLGVSFGPGTAWIETYRDALVAATSAGAGEQPAPLLDDLRLALDDDAIEAVQTTEVSTNYFGAQNADVLWRVAPLTDWNQSRPVSPITSRVPFVSSREYGDERANAMSSVLLFAGASVPPGFPNDGDGVQVIVRYRGPASDAFPYYLEGALGQVLMNFYDGQYSLPPVPVSGMVYDPANLDDTSFIEFTPIRYDSSAFDAMTEAVVLRQIEPVSNGREWAEQKLYSPSGWLPSLDNEGLISPRLRNRPAAIDPALTLTNSKTVPTPAWGISSRTVSEVRYEYPRYFVPTSDEFVRAGDGLSIRPVVVRYYDREAELRYGGQPVEYDASAFAAIGDFNGKSLPGQQETAAIMAQAARFDVLERYRSGAQSFSIDARRNLIPAVRVGDWVPWDLSWLPDRVTGLRGSQSDAAQIIAIRDDNCVWRTITLEESGGLGSLGGVPGYVDSLVVIDTDDVDPGIVQTLVVIDDADMLTPDAYPGLVAWFEASDLDLPDTTPVSTWTNKTESGLDATQAGAQRPTFKTNAFGLQPAMHFSGTQFFALTGAALGWYNGTSGGAFLLVIRPSSAAFGQLFNFLVGAALSGRFAVQIANPGILGPDGAWIFQWLPIGDGTWTAVNAPTRTAGAFVCADGTVLDLIGDTDAVNTSMFTKATPAMTDQCQVMFRISKSASYASHRVIVRDTTAGGNRLELNIDFTGAIPKCTVVTPGVGITQRVYAKGDGSFDVQCITAGMTPANAHEIQVIPAAGSVADTADFYIGDLRVVDASIQPRTLNVIGQAPDGTSPGVTNFYSQIPVYRAGEALIITGSIDLLNDFAFSELNGRPIVPDMINLNAGAGGVPAFSATDSLGASIGARGSDGASPFAGDMAAIVLWNEPRTKAELALVREYFAQKYSIPQYVAFDDFERKDGTIAGSVTPMGQVWSNVFGGGTDFTVDTRRARRDGLAFDLIDTGISDYEVGWTVVAITASSVIIGFRCADGLNNWQLLIVGMDLYFREFVAGTYPGPQVGLTTVPAIVAGDRVAVRAVGNQVTAIINDVEIVTVTIDSHLNDTIVGIGANGTSVIDDDFYVKDLS